MSESTARSGYRKINSKHPEAIAARKLPPVSGGKVDSVDWKREEIARLAYSYWKDRGCEGGSAEEDWLRAEKEIWEGGNYGGSQAGSGQTVEKRPIPN